MLFQDPDPDNGLTFADFPIGTRVQVVSGCVDHYFFRDDTGTVIRNDGNYLGIIVEFDEPRHYENFVMTVFNFNPKNLKVLSHPERVEVPA